MMRFLKFFLIFSIGLVTAYEPHKSIKWIGGNNIEWGTSHVKASYKNSGRFISKNIIATRAAIWRDDIFLALPRYRTGVPITLAKMSLKGRHSLGMSPFPSWSHQEEGNCTALQSVIDIFLDPYELLWALDTGIVNSLENPIASCPPKIVAYSTKTGKVVKTIDASPLTDGNSRLQYLVVDYSPEGRAFVYVTDAESRAILVFDVASGRGYRVILPKSVSLGCSRRDVLYVSLIRRPDHDNRLIFTYLCGSHVFSIKSSYLQAGSSTGRIRDLGPKGERVVFLGTDNGSALFFRNEGESDVYKWDLMESARDIRMVQKGTPHALPTQVMPDQRRNKMRVLESNFPDYFEGSHGYGVNQAIKMF
ncbi:hypothetical protein QAD02_014677 [Eretmocerus hayati]|uniref:Uncharacterized protein n=1 Tax=Eretmocerus hayati TaxID=131215 RepID=A0ACC2P670_9HYME|nr:hypothetical protein QAD02_014677 [Eretmocerus hayati]